MVSTDDNDLHEAWVRWVSPDTTRLEGLLLRYRERHRRYHTAAHMASVVGNVEQLSNEEQLNDIGTVVAAAFYHDAVYEATYPANERASARLAKRDLFELAWEPKRIETVAAMIEATAKHQAPADIDTAVLFDADLAILGSPSDEYSAYVKAVRSEYRHLDDDEWRTGRSHVIESFLERSEIYNTATGRLQWAEAARINLTKEVETVS